ncbi:replication protein A 70 kDa DNA-binding subunit A [Brassica rapa]|uniref:replication protein A 70 kDa DNA-binding subunit A n=1 Tax=Brassica campestris TaxID=3711 RepID=UPI0004F181D4|nr:replication protein A 70 kDa DNA-binding subunit A [Brassica rapa]
MANSRVLLADLKAGRCSNVAEVRLLRFWEARNVRKGGELMSVDMLFVDENSTLTQGSVGANHQLRFRDRLSEGSLYTLTGFDVTRSNTNFRLSDAPFSIRFNEGTELDKIPTSVRPIPTELFRFMPYSQILELANTGKQLPDIIGELSAIRSTITDRLPGARRVMLTLLLESGENVCVSMFDSMALAFHTKLDSYGREPRVIIVTSVNPKIVGGRLFLNGTSGTHLYFDSETSAGKELFDTLPGHGADPGSSISKVVHAQKVEPMTISELNKFITTADSQIIEFLCTAEVTGIQLDDGWCYIGCSGCSKKLIREISSFTCVSCNETNAVAALRYRVKLSVSDHTDSASFLSFDMEMAKLTNIQASEAAQIVGIGVDAQVDTELPRSLADIVGKTYTFQLKLNDFNFSSKHQTFTISRIFPERLLAPMPAFVVAEGADVPDDAPPEIVAQPPNANVGTTSTGADSPASTDASAAKRPPTAKDQDDVDKTAPKKAHVE